MHMVERYQRSFEEFVQRHAGLILLLGACFVIGVVFGGLAVRGVAAHDRTEVVGYLSETMDRIVHPEASDPGLVFKRSLIRSLAEVGVLWGLGITMVAVPCTLAGALVFGFVSGFTVSFLTAELGWGGLVLAVAGHLPHNLLIIPALLLGGAAAAAFSLQVLRSWMQRRRVPNFYPALARFTGATLVMGLVLLVASLVEGYVTPELAKWAASLLHLS